MNNSVSFLNSTLIPALVSATITVIGSFIVYYKVQKNSEKQWLQDKLFEINKFSITYSYFEDSNFTKSFPNTKRSYDDELRYGTYCVLVFNYIERLLKYHKLYLNHAKSESYISHFLIMHRKWWFNDLEKNLEGYESNVTKVIMDFYSKEEEDNE